MRQRVLAVWIAAMLLARAAAGDVPPADEDAALAQLLASMEAAIARHDRAAWDGVARPGAASVETAFDDLAREGVTRAVLRARDRVRDTTGAGLIVLADAFVEVSGRARISTWRLDIRLPAGDAPQGRASLTAMERLADVDALYRLALDTTRQFAATNLVVQSVDFELRLPSGQVFVADAGDGTTALVLLGRGAMVFRPSPAPERGQLRIFSGQEALETPFDEAFVRLNPGSMEEQVSHDRFVALPPDPALVARARLRFDAEIVKSFSFDLRDLSAETWSVLPQPGDFIAEVPTRRYGALTYARSMGEAEDVSLFDRSRRKHIAVYASPAKLAARGEDYHEDMLAEVDLREFDVDTSVAPDRDGIEGRARLRLRVQHLVVPVLTLRLAESLTVSAVTSDRFGRLLFLRIRDQASLVVNLPEPLAQGEEIVLTIDYRGRVERTGITEDALSVQDGVQMPRAEDMPIVPPEPHWLLSTRTSWYPQTPVSDYATGVLRVTVPAGYRVVGSGIPAGAEPHAAGAGAQTFRFEAPQPVRYLSIVVSRLQPVEDATLAVEIPLSTVRPAATLQLEAGGQLRVVPPGIPPIGSRNTVRLRVEANRRQDARAAHAATDAAAILRFYAGLMGDVPYDTFTLAVVEARTPGGHSPGYFAVLHQPPPASPFVYRTDPASFHDYPEFFLAHELAHQWWGQAVGWKNYHEQWISEGISQYFAALFARERHGDRIFRSMLRSLRRWTEDARDEGPVSLGYRLGHLRDDSRVFRAVVYNKGALVLHLLRQFIGDEAFLQGLRAFYATHRFSKAGTSDLRAAMSEASGVDLSRFFTRWILEPDLPDLRVSTRELPTALEVEVEQDGPVFDLPLPVRLAYADGVTETVIVRVTGSGDTYRVPLRGRLRRVTLNPDGTLPGRLRTERRQRK